MRYHAQKRDISEKGIVQALRSGGADVYLIDEPCDAIVGFHNVSHLAEFKTGKGKLTANQQEFQRTWRGSPIIILRTVEEALSFLAECRKASAQQTARLVDAMRKPA